MVLHLMELVLLALEIEFMMENHLAFVHQDIQAKILIPYVLGNAKIMNLQIKMDSVIAVNLIKYFSMVNVFVGKDMLLINVVFVF